MCSRICRNENTLRNFLYQAQGEYFDLNCESLTIASLVVHEGFKRKWSLPGGEPLLLEYLPTLLLHIYRVLCVHKLQPSLSKTVIGHSYSFHSANATLLAPSLLQQAMQEKQIPLTRRCIQVHAEPACHWSTSAPATLVDCICLLRVQSPRNFLCVCVFIACCVIRFRSYCKRGGKAHVCSSAFSKPRLLLFLNFHLLMLRRKFCTWIALI